MLKRTVSQPDNIFPLSYFDQFRAGIIGQYQEFEGPWGRKRMLYADWTASGRLYRPIEQKMTDIFGPFVANTHTETNVSGTSMTSAYHEAKAIIKKHVNAGSDDCLISYGSGMTGVINKFQRILNLRLPEKWRPSLQLTEKDRPVIFVSHMEHHSNQTSWLETICEVVVIEPTSDGDVDLNHLESLLEKYSHRPHKIAAVTACSNVTGIETPYHEIAALMHRNGGLCFVDFACSAPYTTINMHPEQEEERLDAIYFSPHKFLGGPGSTGILIFNGKLYHNRVPDNPGGGTVKWTNPWLEHDFIDNIEEREDGGTPPFLQTIKVALAVKLKEQMGVPNILTRESAQVDLIFDRLQDLQGVQLLASEHRHRLGVFSMIIKDAHFNMVVKLLNDRYGIQVRGGCSCAGTYGHYLLDVDRQVSNVLTCQISHGDLTGKPGWVRMSIHPTMTDEELHYICDAIEEISLEHKALGKDYIYNPRSNEFTHKTFKDQVPQEVKSWFDL